jgi:hypothetical protein
MTTIGEGETKMKKSLIASVMMLAASAQAHAASRRVTIESVTNALYGTTCDACASWGATMYIKKPQSACALLIGRALRGDATAKEEIGDNFWDVCPQTDELLKETSVVSKQTTDAILTKRHDWQQIGVFDGETLFVDRNSQHGVKNATATVMVDYAESPGQESVSAIFDYQAVCEEKFRVVSATYFSGQSGSGKVTHVVTTPTEWQDMFDKSEPVTQTVDHALLAVCGAFEDGH